MVEVRETALRDGVAVEDCLVVLVGPGLNKAFRRLLADAPLLFLRADDGVPLPVVRFFLLGIVGSSVAGGRATSSVVLSSWS